MDQVQFALGPRSWSAVDSQRFGNRSESWVFRVPSWGCADFDRCTCVPLAVSSAHLRLRLACPTPLSHLADSPALSPCCPSHSRPSLLVSCPRPASLFPEPPNTLPIPPPLITCPPRVLPRSHACYVSARPPQLRLLLLSPVPFPAASRLPPVSSSLLPLHLAPHRPSA